MRNRRWLFLAVVLVVGAAWASTRGGPRKDGGPPFANLDTVLASETKAGWTVFQAPKREGPYRVVLGEGSNATDGVAIAKIRDQDGTVESITLEGSAKEQQKSLVLETRDNHRTLVGLKRSNEPR